MTLRSEEILLAVFLKPNSRRREENLLADDDDEEETAASLLLSFTKAQSPSIKSVNLVLSV